MDSDNPDVSEMLATAYSSFYHWLKREDKTPSDISTAHWLLARVHYKAKQTDLCCYHAEKTLATVSKNNLIGLDKVSALEVMSKSEVLKNNIENAKQYKNEGLALLEDLGAEIGEAEYGYCLEDYNAIELAG
ncbi:hypothetical protein [Salinibius halmophilus]|uniref:hypothetical protein n=1 Tax=Salinibius halmophilus TaxID=1853216 RepID=UPI001314F0AF|nr:hypothetical protein [Salinibius halmophilus]